VAVFLSVVYVAVTMKVVVPTFLKFDFFSQEDFVCVLFGGPTSEFFLQF